MNHCQTGVLQSAHIVKHQVSNFSLLTQDYISVEPEFTFKKILYFHCELWLHATSVGKNKIRNSVAHQFILKLQKYRKT